MSCMIMKVSTVDVVLILMKILSYIQCMLTVGVAW